MAINSVVTRGYGSGGSIALVVLRGYSAGGEIESDSTAGLRYYSRTLDLPGIVLGSGRQQFTDEIAGLISYAGEALSLFEQDIALMVSAVAELGESVTVAGVTMYAIGLVPYIGATLAGSEVEGRGTALYVTATDFDEAAAVLGDDVTFRSVSYTIGRMERLDAGLVRLELVR